MYIKLAERDPSTNSYVWPATVLAIGHKSFIEKHTMDVSMQIRNASGDPNFMPIVSINDPDLTIYENVNQIILNSQSAPQSANRRLDMSVSGSPACSLDDSDIPAEVLNASLIGGPESSTDDQAYESLNPEDVSRTLCEVEQTCNEGNRRAAILNTVCQLLNL